LPQTIIIVIFSTDVRSAKTLRWLQAMFTAVKQPSVSSQAIHVSWLSVWRPAIFCWSSNWDHLVLSKEEALTQAN